MKRFAVTADGLYPGLPVAAEASAVIANINAAGPYDGLMLGGDYDHAQIGQFSVGPIFAVVGEDDANDKPGWLATHASLPANGPNNDPWLGWHQDFGTEVRWVGLNSRPNDIQSGKTKLTLSVVDFLNSPSGGYLQSAMQGASTDVIALMWHHWNYLSNDARGYMLAPLRSWAGGKPLFIFTGGLHAFFAIHEEANGDLGEAWWINVGNAGGKGTLKSANRDHPRTFYAGDAGLYGHVEFTVSSQWAAWRHATAGISVTPDEIPQGSSPIAIPSSTPLPPTINPTSAIISPGASVVLTAMDGNDPTLEATATVTADSCPPVVHNPPTIDPPQVIDPGEVVTVFAANADDPTLVSTTTVTANPGGGGGPPATAAEINAELNLSMNAGGYFSNVRGANEKYLQGTPVYPGGTGWYVLHDDDTLSEFTGPTGSGTPLKTRTVCKLPSGKHVEPIVGSHDDPSLLHDA